MNYQTLRDALVPSGGVVKISRDTLDSGVGTFLDLYYQSQPLHITGAELAAADTTGTSVVVTGRASFLQIPDLSLTARFSLDASGQVQVQVQYQLRDTMPGPAAWTFSRSFAKLPAVLYHSAGFPIEDFSGKQKPFIDSLAMFDTYYIVTNGAGKDTNFGVTLTPGINFVSRLRPQGVVGILENTLKSAEPMVLSGHIQLPNPTVPTLPLTLFQRPWARPDAPGIHLLAALDLDFKLGKLVFDQAAFRAYSPPSTDWLNGNNSFRPLHGYSGRLAIPSAGIELDLSADLQWGLPKVALFAHCEGVTLGKLTQLVDLVGSQDLLSVLPTELQSAVNQLEKLELMDLNAGVELVGTKPQVTSLGFTVGMPSLKWKVWEDKLVVESLACRFDITAPFSTATGTTPKLAVTILGTLKIEGVPFSVMARSAQGFSLYASLASGHTIPLGALLKSHAPGVTAPSELTISSMAVQVAPGQLYAMNMSLSGKPKPWAIPVGRRKINLTNLSFAFTYPKGGPLTGSFAGRASFGSDMTLAMNWTIGRSLVLRGTFNRVTLKGLVSDLCDQPVDLPPSFDLAIESASVVVSQKNDTFGLQMASEIAGLGTFAFEVRSGTSSGFAGGLLLTPGGTPSKVPGLAALAELERAFKLQKFMLVFSSLADPNFTFPDMAQFNAPQLATKQLTLPAGTSGIIAGLNIFGEWVLDTGDKKQNLLKTLLGLGGTEQIAIQIARNPSDGSRLFATRRGKLSGRPFFYTFGIMMTGGQPSLFLTGSVTVDIQKQPRTFDLTTMFVPGGAFLSATMKSQAAIDCGPFKLSNLAMEVGVNWGGIPSLGLAATIDFKDFSSSVAVFFDSADPARSLIAGSISNLNARDILRAFVGGVQTPLDDLLKSIAIRGTHQFTIPGDLTDELDGLVLDKVAAAFAVAKVTIPSASQQLTLVPKTRGASWHLTDLTKMRHYQLAKKGDTIQVEIAPQFYFAPQATSIGSVQYPQAFYLNAAFSFAGFDAAATIDISPNKGFSIAAQLDKIVVFDERVFSIAALQGGGGPQLSVSTFAQPDNPVAAFRLPHFYINGSLTLLGVKQGIYASVSVQGIEFELVGQLVPGVTFDLDARFGKSGFGAGGKVKVGIGTVDLGKLGKAKINTQLEVELDLDIDAGGSTDVSLQGGSSFPAGATLLTNEIARLVFQTDGNLVLYKTSGEPLWASNTVGKGANQVAFQDDGNFVLYAANGRPVWASSSNSANNRLTLQKDGNLVIYDGTGRARWATGTNGAWATSGAHLEMESSFEFGGQHIDIAKFRIDASADTFTQLPTILGKKVEQALGEVFKDMTKWANAVKDGVMDGVDDTAKVFKDVYGQSEKEAKALANTIGKGTGQATKAVENVAKDVGKTTEKTAKKVIKKVKFW